MSSNEKISIILPIKKNYYNTFINSLISIHFLNEQTFSLESLKNLLFPPSLTDDEFNSLVKFILLIFDELIKNSKDKIILEKDLRKIVIIFLNSVCIR